MRRPEELENVIRYRFSDGSLLRNALCHSSYAAEQGHGHAGNNERLEFIGDAFLDAVIGLELYRMLPEEREGTLSKRRAAVVCERSLAAKARELDLGSFLYLGNGEEMTGGRNKDSILADALEAVIGAVVLDGGYPEAERVVLGMLADTVRLALDGKLFMDYKTELQERIQDRYAKAEIRYELTGESGPDHEKTFTVTVLVNGKPLGTGSGRNKKEAEQNAARDVITRKEL